MNFKKIIKLLVVVIFGISVYFPAMGILEVLSYMDWDTWYDEYWYFIFAAVGTGWILYETRQPKSKNEHSQ